MEELNDTNVVILPKDGYATVFALLSSLQREMSMPAMKEIVGIIKLNDALHFPYVGPAILEMIDEVVPLKVRKFIDLKLADVSETNKNVLMHYRQYKPYIVTVTSTVSVKSLLKIKEALPETHIALVDTLTDISAEEIDERWQMNAAEKITKALRYFSDHFKGSYNPISMVVSGPKEVPFLYRDFGDEYKYISPGIRSPHMAKDHQERVTSAYSAIKFGVDYLVMGAQLTKGNSDKEISAEQSQLITLEEIKKALSER